MEFSNWCVFDPSLGTEDSVNDQLVYTNGEFTTSEFINLIGVTQGVMELAYAFATDLLQHIELQQNKIVLVSLTTPQTDNWRARLWFVGEYKGKLQVPVISNLIRQNYHLSLLLQRNKPFASLTSMDNCYLASAFTNSQRMANGSLNPISRTQLDELLSNQELYCCVYTTDGLVYTNSIDVSRKVDLYVHNKIQPVEPQLTNSIVNTATSVLGTVKYFLGKDSSDLMPKLNIDEEICLPELHKIRLIPNDTFTICYIYKPEIEQQISDNLASQILDCVDGLNFAPTPPTNFLYLLANERSYITTCPNHVLTELADFLTPILLTNKYENDEPQISISRVKNYWIWTSLSSGNVSVVAKAVGSGKRPGKGFMTDLHDEVTQWLSVSKPDLSISPKTNNNNKAGGQHITSQNNINVKLDKLAMAPGPYLSNDKSTFAYVSFAKRYPVILENIISDLEKHVAQNPAKVSAEAAEEVPVIAQQIRALAKSIADNDLMTFMPETNTKAKVFNAPFEGKNWRWLDGPWLDSECLMYALVNQFFADSKHFKNFDYFALTKNDTFVKSADAVSTLADRYVKISETEYKFGSEEHSILFHELLTTSLWGNATDLSLLVTVSLEELKKLQVAAADREKESLLSNDIPEIWKKVSAVQDGRIDIVLDNSGFELYTDIVLALFLLDSKLADQVAFHPKSMPWFISDVMPHDFASVISMLENPEFFPKNRESVDKLVSKIKGYFEAGMFVLRTSDFWTMPYSFYELTPNGVGKDAYDNLKNSKLVIFKGDLNYRKVVGDLEWPKTTKFVEAIGPLANTDLPIATLRTVKADVCVGLAEGKEEELNKLWPTIKPEDPPQGWLWSGKYAVLNAKL